MSTANLEAVIQKTEIERKYLVEREHLPEEFEVWDVRNITHGILSHPQATYELRVTSEGDEHFATLKSSAEQARLELQTPISREAFLSHFASTGDRIEKTRYTSPDGVEVDVFRGHLAGLRLAEVEFIDSSQADKFVAPEWFGGEVTNLNGFYNRNLARLHHREPLTNTMESGLTQLRERMATARTERPYIIGIAGPSGSGKTTFARQLARVYEENGYLLSVDDWNRGRTALTELNEGETWQNWDLPVVYDTEKMAKDIQKLLSGEGIPKYAYDFNASEPQLTGMREAFRPHSVVIIEGLYATDENIRPLLDTAIYVDADPAERMVRRLTRDAGGRKAVWTPEQILAYMIEVVEPTGTQYVLPQKQRADIVIENN